MFHVIENELRWRRESGSSEGFGNLRRQKPLVAVGADEPCTSQMMIADYFRVSIQVPLKQRCCLTNTIDGRDGLGGVHTSVSSTRHYRSHIFPTMSVLSSFPPSMETC